MKQLLLIASLALSIPLLAQQTLIIPVKNQVIVADTSGKLVVNKRLDDVSLLSQNWDSYLLTLQNKRGVLCRGEVIIPIAYERINMLNKNQLYRCYAVQQNGKFALFNGLGNKLTDFEFQSIIPYDSDHYSYAENGNFYLKFKTALGIQLAHIDAKNNLVWDMPTPIERINDRKNVFVFKQNNMWALYKSVDGFSTLEKLSDFSTLKPYLGYDFIYLTNEKEKYVLKYDYNFKLIKRFNNTTKIDEYPYAEEIADIQDGVYIRDVANIDPNRYDHKELLYKRATVFIGKDQDLAPDFRFNERIETHIPQQDKFQATVFVSGTKGNFQAKIYYSDDKNRPVADTVISLPYDKVIVPLTENNVYLIVKQGKNYGVVDTRGNLAVPVSYKAIEICTNPEGMQWIIKRTANGAEVEYYDSQFKQSTLLTRMGPKDNLRFDANYFFVDIMDGGQKGKTAMYKWYFYSIGGKVHIGSIGLYGRYDKVVTLHTLPFFFATTDNKKHGLLGKMGSPKIPPLYDSLHVELVYEMTERSYLHSDKLVPVVLAYRGPEVYYLHPGNDFKSTNGFLHEGKPIRVSDDGLLLIKEMGNGKVQLFAQNGAPLHSGTVQLDETNQYFVSHYEWYWYVLIKDAENRDAILGRNGVQIVLPE